MASVPATAKRSGASSPRRPQQEEGQVDESGLEIRAFDPGQKVNRGFYAEVPIALEFYGSYHELATFFDRLSRLSRIVNITQLDMKLESNSGDRPKLQIKGVATTFQFLSSSSTAGE